MRKTGHIKPASGGFTLIEVLVVVALIAIMLSIAAPSFSRMIASSRMASQTNEFLAALSLARSEAARRGSPVSVRSVNSTGSFAGGWEVFSDANGDGSKGATPLDGGVIARHYEDMRSAKIERVVRSTGSAPYTYTTDTTSIDRMFVTFNSRGVPSSSPLYFRICENNAAFKGRVVEISPTGRSGVTVKDLSC